MFFYGRLDRAITHRRVRQDDQLEAGAPNGDYNVREPFGLRHEPYSVVAALSSCGGVAAYIPRDDDAAFAAH
jgi:hypothetical protein